MFNNTLKISRLQEQFKKLTSFQSEIFNLLVKHSTRYNSVTLSQSTIALWLGCSRMTVSRSIKYFISMGLLNVEYRHRKTLIYKIHHSIRLMVHNIASRKIIPALNNLKFKIIGEWFSSVEKKHNTKQIFQNVTPYKEDKRFNNSYTMVERQCARAKQSVFQLMGNLVDRFKYKSTKTQEKGVVVMSEYAKPHISPLMRQITDALHLTKHGQIRLLIYDEKSLQAAFNNIDKALMSNDPFYYFGEYCHGYSIQHALPIKMELYEAMIKRYSISINSAYVIVPAKKITLKVKDISDRIDFTQEVQHFKENQNKMHPSFAFAYPGSN